MAVRWQTQLLMGTPQRLGIQPSPQPKLETEPAPTPGQPNAAQGVDAAKTQNLRVQVQPRG